MVYAFTGHRPNKIGGYNNSVNKRNALFEALNKIHFQEPLFLSGMALGVDQWVAEYAISSNIPFVACIPFEGQESRWPTESRVHYHFLLNHAKHRVYVCSRGYAAWKMQKRNEYMVDHCDILIAVWDGTDGGTANCYRYAEKLGKSIIRINPTLL